MGSTAPGTLQTLVRRTLQAVGSPVELTWPADGTLDPRTNRVAAAEPDQRTVAASIVTLSRSAPDGSVKLGDVRLRIAAFEDGREPDATCSVLLGPRVFRVYRVATQRVAGVAVQHTLWCRAGGG